MTGIHFGVDRQEFFDNVYGKKWLLQRQALSVLRLTWKNVDFALYALENASTQIKLYKEGAVDPSQYTEIYWELGEQRTRIVKDILYRYLKDGATLVLNKLQLYMPEINDYCMDVAQFVGEKTNANSYIAFGGKGTFGKHWDTHDVFALQLIGRKRWRLYQPTFELPLNHQTSLNHKAECPPEPVLDTVLEAGDMLYIPRGWWHEALPIEGEETFHIAIGTFPPKFLDYLVWLCVSRLPDCIESRQAINSYLDAAGPYNDFAQTVQSMLVQPEHLEAFCLAFAEQQRVKSRFNIAGVSPAAARDSQQSDSVPKVRINSFYPLSSGQETLLVNGFKLNLDSISSSFLADIGSFKDIQDNHINDFDNMSEKQMQLLEQLSVLDVIEIS